jgi:hypothetical protein
MIWDIGGRIIYVFDVYNFAGARRHIPNGRRVDGKINYGEGEGFLPELLLYSVILYVAGNVRIPFFYVMDPALAFMIFRAFE